ncbi:hypothetical protein CCH79_00014254 [Gambusia affinis]|uniref:Uncharacterized protein n=1 Tax=Gambusia affinis TaxID=33528 RepID=A0A315UT38_GAMAF|nr:hypothetical protein CCH79_00014254 [Gambusia affinis]
MYTITRGPSKLVTQRRTGPTQQVESKFSDLKLKPTSWLTSNFLAAGCSHLVKTSASTRLTCPNKYGFSHFPANDRRAVLPCSSPPPKIVFNRLNGKRHNGSAPQKSRSPAAEGFTPAHEENVRFVYEDVTLVVVCCHKFQLFVVAGSKRRRRRRNKNQSVNQLSHSNVTGIWILDTTVWQEVEQKLEDRGESADSKGPVQYAEKTPGTVMKNFVPIDLEEWWGQRFLANIANLS